MPSTPQTSEAASAAPGPQELASEAVRLVEAGRPDLAADRYALLVARLPGNPALRHNFASLLADAGRFEEAESEARSALQAGLNAPETWLVLAHALQGQGRFDDAEGAYDEAIARRPGFALAHRDLADLVWMRSGDLGAALARLEAALRATPGDLQLIGRKAQVLEYAGEPAAAYSLLAEAAASTNDPWLEVAAAQSAMAGAPHMALAHARRAFDSGLRARDALVTLCEAHLAAGEVDAAGVLALELVERDPLDQRALCLQATAWRLLRDARYKTAHAYDSLVQSFLLEPPEGWPDLQTFLRDLAAAIVKLHTLRAHPVGQSIRGGSQSQQSLLHDDTPALRAFFQAVRAPIRAYLAATAEHGLLPGWRSPFGFRIAGAWSVFLRPGGRHVSHMHPSGRISSAFHVELPAAVGAADEGWLSFGEPDVPTIPPLGPDHMVKPKPGQLILFPSYMTHGTVPFTGTGRRLAVAFDVVADP